MNARFTDDGAVDNLPPATPDDKELALAFQRGETDAYRTIYDRYEERVHRVCRRMLGKPEDAQEAAQETFLRAYTALGKFNGRYQLGAWITRIATNVCLDQIRARSRRPVEATPVEELEIELSAGPDSDPEVVTVRAAETRRVRKVLQDLPPLHRAAIVLRDFEGLSYADVAIALGITECQVKALIHRARKGFRRSWKPLLGFAFPSRLIHRLREGDWSFKEQVTHAAASQTAPLASVCSGLLQQCGTFVVERVVPVGMTLLVGGGAAVAAVPSAVDRTARETVAASADPGSVAARTGAAARPASDRPAPTAPPSTPTAPPASTSAPSPSEPPEPPPSPTPSPSASPSVPPESASPPPAGGTATTPKSSMPGELSTTFYFDQGQATAPRQSTQAGTVVDCDAATVDQTLRTMVSDRDGAYPIDVRLRTSSSYLQIEFTVHKKGAAVYYSGGGSLASRSTDGNVLHLSFTGRYGASESAAVAAGLPSKGSIRADFSLDCQSQSLMTESVAFTTQ